MNRHSVISMMQRQSGRSAGCRCALAATVLLLVLVAQDQARAACGDYVFVRDASGKLVPASEWAARQGMPAAHSSAPLGKRCQGPTCSERPSLPPATPAAPIVWPVSPEAFLASGDDCDRPENDLSHPGGAPPHTIHHPGRIFHPPRFRAHA